MDEWLIWIVFLTSNFAFLSVFFWVLQRRREREAYYRYELARQLLEKLEGAERLQLLAWLEDQEVIEERRRRGGMLLSALLLVAIGVGFLILFFDSGGHQARIGWLVLLIGISMLIYLRIVRGHEPPKDEPDR